MAQPSSNILRFTGHLYIRQRLVLSLLSGRTVRIGGIRSDDVNPGLRDHEISLLRLLSKITNGSIIDISTTGTSLLFTPGVLLGGHHTHDCPLSVSVGYFLEPLSQLAFWGKKDLSLTLRGITSGRKDLGVDLIRTYLLPTMQLFGELEGLELKIVKRGAEPLGGGEILFRCPSIRSVKTLNFVDPGRVKRIRGVAHSVRVSPQFSNRLVESSRSLLNPLIPDIYIYTDPYKSAESGLSPGYGLSLLSESTTGAMHCAEVGYEKGSLETPEDVGRATAALLLSEISGGGCVGTYGQGFVLLAMVLGSEDVGRVRLGKLSANSIQLMRDIRTFFSTTFKITPVKPTVASKSSAESDQDEDDDESTAVSAPKKEEFILSCLGVGFSNVNKSVV